MIKRKIVKIDEEKCNGCGLCLPNCPEGALQIIDGKAHLVSDLFCDGLGACIGECPKEAITIEERAAEPYDEKMVMKNMIKKGDNVVKAHLQHLKDHDQHDYLQEALAFLKNKGIVNLWPGQIDRQHESQCGCPGALMMDFRTPEPEEGKIKSGSRQESALRQWPVQISLVPPNAPYFKRADVVVTADCVPLAYANFHLDFLAGRIALVGCPKLDDINFYQDKMTEIFRQNEINSVTVLTMEVPCCLGLKQAVAAAVNSSGKSIPLNHQVISLRGQRVQTNE